jgi:hypothetical protein
VIRHIKQFGRILPADLDGYIGQNLLLFNAILQAQGNVPFNRQEQEELFSSFNSFAIEMLPDNLKAVYQLPFE